MARLRLLSLISLLIFTHTAASHAAEQPADAPQARYETAQPAVTVTPPPTVAQQNGLPSLALLSASPIILGNEAEEADNNAVPNDMPLPPAPSAITETLPASPATEEEPAADALPANEIALPDPVMPDEQAPAANEPIVPPQAEPVVPPPESEAMPQESVPEQEAIEELAPEDMSQTPDTAQPAPDADTPPAAEDTQTTDNEPATIEATPASSLSTRADPLVLPQLSLPLPISKLSLEESIGLAIKNSPEREIASQQVQQALYSVDEARAGYWPQANVRLDEGREYNNPFAIRQGATQFDGYNYGRSANLNIRQMVYDGSITRETVKQRMQLLESSRLSRKKINEELIKTTAEVYMEVREFQQILIAAHDNLTALREIARLIKLRVDAGDASQAEQNYMEARLANAEQQYLNIQASLSDSFSALTYLVGDIPEFSAMLPDMESYQVITAEELLAKAPENNLDAQLVASDIKAAHHEMEAAKGRYHPTLDIVADGTKSDDLGGRTGIHENGSIKLQLNFMMVGFEALPNAGRLQKSVNSKRATPVSAVKSCKPYASHIIIYAPR